MAEYRVDVKKADYERYHERLELAERYTQKEFKPIFDRADRLYRGLHYKSMQGNPLYSRVVNNVIKQFIDTRVDAIAFSNPDANVRPLTEDMENNAKVLETTAEWFWRNSNSGTGFQDQFKLAYADCEKYDFGVVHIYWDLQKGEELKGDVAVDSRAAEGTDGGGEAPQADALATEGTPGYGDEAPGDSETAYFRKIKDEPCAKRIHPLQFLIPPTARRLSDAKWCGYIDFVLKDELKQQFKLPKGVKTTAQSLQDYLTDEQKERLSEGLPLEEKDCQYVKITHYFDRVKRLHAIFADGVDKPIYACRWRWQGDYFPFAVIHGDDYGNTFFGNPLPIRMAPLQKLINRVWSKYADAVTHSGPAFLVRRGDFDRNAKEQAQSPEYYRFIEHNSRDYNPVGVLPMPPIPVDNLNVEAKAKEAMRSEASLSEFEAMTSLSKRLTAQEAQAIEQGSGIRSAAAAQRFERFCKSGFQILMDLILLNLTDVLTLPILDHDARSQGFVTFDREQMQFMQGKYMVEVHVGSTTVRTNTDRIKDIAFLLQSLQEYVQMPGPDGQPLLDLAPLIRELLHLIPDLRHIGEIMRPAGAAPPPGVLPPGPGQPMLPPGLPPGALPPALPPGMDGMGGIPQALPPEMVAAGALPAIPPGVLSLFANGGQG